LGTKYLVVLCAGSTLPLAKQSLDEAPYKLSGAVAKLAGIIFGRLSPSYSWGFQLAGHLLYQLHANKFSGTIITAPSVYPYPTRLVDMWIYI
jgi:hypothetical protein